jgi:hypothetical protein
VKEISAQVIGPGRFQALDMDMEAARAYKRNQIVQLRVKGTQKPRSVKQLNLYWKCCGLVAENTVNPMWNTKEKVDFQCRTGLHFVDPDLVAVKADGTVVFSYRSIAFRNLRHIESCKYIDRAIQHMADFLGCTAKQLIAMAKEGMS